MHIREPISKEHFELLVSLTPIHSLNLKSALFAYFVDGLSLKEIRDQFKVNTSYLSLKIRVIQDVSRTVVSLYPYYHELLSRKQ